MSLYPFVMMFPEQGEAECRVAHVRNHPSLPDDDYALAESYCVDPNCDCRRVLINVLPRVKKRILASVSFGFDRDQKLAGPFLDPFNPQSKYADDLLELVEHVLSDPAYVARLESHYRQVKEAVADPTHPARQLLDQDGEGRKREPLVKGSKIGRNDPCPCGSGKKYKKCCGK